MDNLPEPMVPEACDLRDFPFTPIFRARLFGSEFHARASDGGWRAGVTLWLKSWDQVPAGSLPDDDVSLCRLAELGRDRRAWAKVKDEALHGWVKCADGRLYHPVVAEGVTEAWARKIAQRERTAAARAAREAKRKEEAARVSGGSNTGSDNAPCDATTDTATTSVTDAVTASKGQGQGQLKKEEGDNPERTMGDAAGAAARGTRLPDDWELPREWADWAIGHGHMRPIDEAEKFHDHWRAQPGAKGRKTDWEATWRNWVRRALEGGRRPGPLFRASPQPSGLTGALVRLNRGEVGHG